MDESKIVFDLGILKHFINNSLGLDYDSNEITGFELLNSILCASAHNTYVETICDKADTLYRRIKESPISMTTHAYLNYIKRLSAKLKLNEKEVVVKKIILTIVIIAAFSVLFVNDYMTKTALLGMALIIAISFYLWISIRAVEKISMLKYVEPMKLTEGDWIVKDIVYNGKKIVGPKDLGIEKNQIKILIGLYKKGKIRKVLIKEGIPFVPSFFLAFIVTLIFGNLIWMII